MLRDKINAIISEVNSQLAEREELVYTIALALLTRKNLFVLGDPGQAKSQAIDSFRSHIRDARQFEILMSKGIDQEQLFGRLDLASIIPGHVSGSVLNDDEGYKQLSFELECVLRDAAGNTDCAQYFNSIQVKRERLEEYRKALAEIKGNAPQIITAGKIPDSHICFLDEIFKANDGVLNSLLKALNERTYTNEGVVVNIPVISFFSASNEIPNFNNPEEKSLRALYDRFDFKVFTRNVEAKQNRMDILRKKQGGQATTTVTYITLEELAEMQKAVSEVKVPDSINELADNILCELRRKDISVSDRTYFNFAPVVQANAYLCGRDTVKSEDMKALINYLWNKPHEYAVVEQTISRLTENPLGDKLDKLLAEAFEHKKNFDAATDKLQALVTLRKNLVKVYIEAEKLKDGLTEGDAAISAVDGMISSLEALSKEAHDNTGYTYLPLSELKAFFAVK